ncbi:MAG TPA: hypothetical protein VM733_19505 [Thermoanaerobaculia bacterium]|nr:hypothetical protein [Thermoanaerobaculia bacterium]
MTSVVATAPAEESSLARVWRAVKRLYQFLLPLRFSFIALIAIAFAFLISAQGYDIIANLAEDDPTGASPSHDAQRAGYIISVIFLALQIWYWSREMVSGEPQEGHPHPDEYPWLTRWLPRILGALTFLISMAALWRVGHNYGVPEPVAELREVALWLALSLVLFILFCIFKRRERPLVTKFFLGLSVVLAIVMFIWCTFFVQTTVVMGSAAVVLIAFALIVPVGSLLVWLGMRTGVPTLTFLMLWGLVISPLTDNHVVKTIPVASVERPSIVPAFDRWFERLDRDFPTADGTHPVIFVATEGGGIRAAYWTAAVLTSLTDTIPAFDEHTFAISAVSGGALGSTVYDALLVKHHLTSTKLEDYHPQAGEQSSLRFAAKQMLSQDSLAPTLAAMTQPDLAQRFIPIPILPDRARALEGGWEHAWRTAIARRDGKSDDDTFAGGFLSLMKGHEDRVPSLFLNGTIVETGERIVASNLHVDSDSGEPLAESIDLFEAIGGDLRVSTAVANSTRFTYVSPAGTLRRAQNANGGSPLQCAPGARCEHVVDGGYFENSGSATISDVLDMVARSKYASRMRPHIIFIQFEMATPPPVKSERFGNEVLSPVRALLAVRGAHADLAKEELKEQFGAANYTTFALVQTKAVFPLGWLLAHRTRNLMDQQMGPNSAKNGANVRRIAALLKQPIGRDLVQELAARGERAPKFRD